MCLAQVSFSGKDTFLTHSFLISSRSPRNSSASENDIVRNRILEAEVAVIELAEPCQRWNASGVPDV